MFEKILSIDLGSSSVKTVLFQRKLSGLEILNYSMYEYQETEELEENEIIHSLLSRIRDEHPEEKLHVVTNLPMEHAVIRNFSFPFTEKDKIREALPFEAEESLPFEIDEMNITFQTIEHEGPEGRVLMAAVKKSGYEKFVTAFKDAGLELSYVGLESNALFESLHRHKLPNKIAVQLDIGHTKSLVLIAQNGRVIQTRSLPFGTGYIIDMLGTMLKCSDREARQSFESLKLDITSLENNYNSGFYSQYKLTKRQVKQLYDAAREYFTELVSQVELTLQKVQSEFEGTDIDRLFLSGGGSHMVRLSEFFGEEIDIPVASLPKEAIFPDATAQSRYALCAGTAYAYDKRNNLINFSTAGHEGGTSSFDFKRLTPAFFFLFCTLIIFLLMTGLNAFFSMKQKAHESEVLVGVYNKNFATKLPESSDPITYARTLLKQEEDKLKVLESVVPNDEEIMTLIEAIVLQLPEETEMELKSFTISEKSITISGSSTSSTNIDAFKNSLSTMQKFESVTLNTRATSADSVSFTMNIKLKTE